MRILKKRVQSFGYAGRGIRIVFGTEANMKIHICIAILVLICGFTFKISTIEWICCLLCIGLVFGMEMANTAIENIVDLVSPNHHPLAGKAKDIAAGAVLICAIISVIVGLLIFVPKAWNAITLFH
ncbi:MAG TPA: diacylglycerol kinase family protein [Paludibacter sp.]|jgi:diacylglycerol kinase|nr:diacylglycerol kinase family protein [Paludibacter sp.]